MATAATLSEQTSVIPPAPVSNSTSTGMEKRSRGNGGSKTPFQTVVFSRKTTYHGPDIENADNMKKKCPDAASPLASLVHQSDRNGKQNEIVTTTSNGVVTTGLKIKPVEPRTSMTSGGGSSGTGISKLFANICSALGIPEQQQLQQLKQQQHANSSTHSRGGDLNAKRKIIGPMHPMDMGKKCLVLDLDETLVHSSFKPTTNPDYIIPVEIENHVHQVYVCKRPGVDEFMKEMAKYYEIVVYTASLSKYADPLLDQLDIHKVIRYRLFREHCVHYEGSYVKDLSLLDREITQTIIIDNSPMSYLFHPRNAIGCSTFIDDMEDKELYSINSFLTKIATVDDIRNHVHLWSPQF